MNIAQMYELVKDSLNEYSTLIWVFLIGIMSLIQVVPVKLNPWSALASLFRHVGHLFNSDVIHSIEDIDKKVDKLSSIVDDNETDRIRYEIRAFANSCQRGEPHTKDDFIHIFNINRKYHDILDRLGKTNGEVDMEMRYLQDLFQDMQENDSFLK